MVGTKAELQKMLRGIGAPSEGEELSILGAAASSMYLTWELARQQ